MNNNDYFASVSVLCFYLNFNVICKCPMSCKKASTILKCWTVYITYLTVTGNVLDCNCYFKHCKVSNEQTMMSYYLFIEMKIDMQCTT